MILASPPLSRSRTIESVRPMAAPNQPIAMGRAATTEIEGGECSTRMNEV
jgi:hypothetical protein